jgi:hypothetical protein
MDVLTKWGASRPAAVETTAMEVTRVGWDIRRHRPVERGAATASAGLLVVDLIGLFRMEPFRIKQQ